MIHGEMTPYLVHCVKNEDFGSCGQSTYLTKEQYIKQMNNPSKGWTCPQCGCFPCKWDSDNYENQRIKK